MVTILMSILNNSSPLSFYSTITGLEDVDAIDKEVIDPFKSRYGIQFIHLFH
jgi:hypothetical protein